MADYEFPEDCRYTDGDEWLRPEGDGVRVGISDYAQCQLGDVVFVELPEVGATLEKGKSFGAIESVKAVSDLFAPVSGSVIAVNGALEDAPEKVNEACYGDGWIRVLKPDDPGEGEALMDAAAYRAHVAARED